MEGTVESFSTAVGDGDVGTRSHSQPLLEWEPSENVGKDASVASSTGKADAATGSPSLPPGGSSGGKLTAFPLALLIFYNVSGGPFGTEPAIRAGGVLYALIGFAIMPFLWAIPEVYVVADMCKEYPCPSGGSRWVNAAFGLDAGAATGYMSWIGGVTSNATFPVLILEYVLHLLYPNSSSKRDINAFLRYGILAGMTLILAFGNYRGLDFVGKVTTVMLFISMTPFVVMIIMGIPKVDPNRWLQTPGVEDSLEDFDDDGVDDNILSGGWFPFEYVAGIAIRPFLNNLYWNFNNFDQAANFSAEVDPSTFSKGIFGSLVMVSSSYLLPLLIATGATDYDQDEWTEGRLAAAGAEIGGQWLGYWIVLGSATSLIALFFAEMSADALCLMGLAERGLILPIFGVTSRYGTPTYAIMLATVVILSLIPLRFGVILELSNMTYAISIIVEFLAFIKLRIVRGDRTKIRKATYMALVIPPLFITVIILCLASYAAYIYTAVLIFLGFFVHKTGQYCNKSNDEEIIDAPGAVVPGRVFI